MKTSIEVENIKCGGCSSRIISKLSSIENIENVEIDIEQGVISYDHKDDDSVSKVIKVLKVMGYPEKGTGTSLHNAKSYVSCMIGRMQN
jgi:copper chaperone CopZ